MRSYNGNHVTFARMLLMLHTIYGRRWVAERSTNGCMLDVGFLRVHCNVGRLTSHRNKYRLSALTSLHLLLRMTRYYLNICWLLVRRRGQNTHHRVDFGGLNGRVPGVVVTHDDLTVRLGCSDMKGRLLLLRRPSPTTSSALVHVWIGTGPV